MEWLRRTKTPEQEAIEAYNTALAAKYRGDWPESLRQNQLADRLRPGDEATLWNLAISATALHEWDEARRAWKAQGIEVNDGPGEVFSAASRACVRIDPQGCGEVVWGTRLDPARMQILNVPFPESRRRYGDILLNDGAPEGTRTSQGREYLVFNELALWKMSPYSTYEVRLIVPNQTAEQSLQEKCEHRGLWLEDWSSVRILCAKCSRGNPGEHVCDAAPPVKGRYGFAAKSETELRDLLREWVEVEPEARFEEIKLVLSGVSA